MWHTSWLYSSSGSYGLLGNSLEHQIPHSSRLEQSLKHSLNTVIAAHIIKILPFFSPLRMLQYVLKKIPGFFRRALIFCFQKCILHSKYLRHVLAGSTHRKSYGSIVLSIGYKFVSTREFRLEVFFRFFYQLQCTMVFLSSLCITSINRHYLRTGFIIYILRFIHSFLHKKTRLKNSDSQSQQRNGILTRA